MRQHVRWQVLAPNLQPYYPVKCNSSPAIIELLASLGLGFVCTNKVGLSSTAMVVALLLCECLIQCWISVLKI
jgi:hypothetical protein